MCHYLFPLNVQEAIITLNNRIFTLAFMCLQVFPEFNYLAIAIVLALNESKITFIQVVLLVFPQKLFVTLKAADNNVITFFNMFV